MEVTDMKKVDLCNNWKLETKEYGNLNVTVPGCVHTDLLANGIIEDFFGETMLKSLCG